MALSYFKAKYFGSDYLSTLGHTFAESTSFGGGGGGAVGGIRHKKKDKKQEEEEWLAYRKRDKERREELDSAFAKLLNPVQEVLRVEPEKIAEVKSIIHNEMPVVLDTEYDYSELDHIQSDINKVRRLIATWQQQIYEAYQRQEEDDEEAILMLLL